LKRRDEFFAFCGFDEHMIPGGSPGEEDGHMVIALACEESVACHVRRRVNALLLLEDRQIRREGESTEDAELYHATSQSRRQTMLKSHSDSASQAVQDAARDIAQISTDVSECAARAGTEIFQRNAETVQEALQSTGEIAARLTETSADQFGRMFGISGEEAHKAAQKSSDNLEAIIQSSSVLAEVIQSISREWANFARERMERNLNRFESLLRCRTPQDVTAVQSEILRDNLESFLQCARRIAKISMQVPDEANKGTPEAAEATQAA
jgi:hypothetical protein